MAEHTRSSIIIEAAPEDVMGVIADFERYPEWTGEVKEAEVLSRDAEGRAQQVRLLLDAGVPADAVYHNDLTALMWAAGYGKVETMRTLLAAGARADRRDDRGKTALDIAREQKQPEAAALLESALAAKS